MEKESSISLGGAIILLALFPQNNTKAEKRGFQPTFGVWSTQTVVKIYNNYFMLSGQSDSTELKITKISKEHNLLNWDTIMSFGKVMHLSDLANAKNLWTCSLVGFINVTSFSYSPLTESCPSIHMLFFFLFFPLFLTPGARLPVLGTIPYGWCLRFQHWTRPCLVALGRVLDQDPLRGTSVS